MPVYRLGEDLVFPPPDDAEGEEGLLAVGGDLSPERLVLAYASGIFPWYSDGEPILWHSPDPRFVLTTDALRIPRSVRRLLAREPAPFRVTLDTSFREVIDGCAAAPRPGEPGTWITSEMRDAYTALHERGLAHSVEAWSDGELVGGAYGVSLGAIFFGESMFSRVPEASKYAFVKLARQLDAWEIRLIDCQVPTDHLSRFGAEEWSRERYLDELREALIQPTRPGPWSFGEGLALG